jgi:SAM-dependent methyltransferase
MLRDYWPRRVGPAEPLAAALRDHHRTGRPRHVHAKRSDGVSFTIETDEYFTLDGSLAELDRLALDRCRGRVLDVGAGAGRHALALQASGHHVIAIDLSPICVALCKERGVRDVRTLDVMTLDSDEPLGRFDTILFGMQTIGVAGGVRALGRMLTRMQNCLTPEGELIVDSSALREAWEGDESDLTASRGEIVLSMRYRGFRGEYFPWLYLAEKDLANVAAGADFEMETLGRIESGEYLAVLRRRESTAR